MITDSRTNIPENGGLFQSWRDSLGSRASCLGAVAISSEREFLSLGSSFQELWGRARSLTSLAEQMTQVVAGENFVATSVTINGVIGRLGEYLDNLRQDMENTAADFQEIVGMLQTAKAPLVGFGKINKVLRMLGISTKIESSRLGGKAAGFETLANDVTRLSVEVVTRSETITTQLNGLEGVIVETLQRVKSVERHQHSEVRITLQRAQESLSMMDAVNIQRSEAAVCIGALSAEMEQRLAEIITFMQFHDIVRQQLEHVQEAFNELCTASDGVQSLTQPQQHDLAVEIGDICELQTAQLTNSAGELKHAVSTITGCLASISSKGGALALEVRKMAGVSDQTDRSFFSTMEQEIAGVTRVLAESAQEINRLTEAMTKVIGTIGEIISFVADIETIGEEIELIALNAQIKAARVGSEGAALGVLAEAIQRLSIDTMEETAAVAQPLQAIEAVTGRLQGRVAEDSAAIDRDVHGMIDELTGSLKEICSVQNDVLALVGSMDGTVDTLQEDISAGISGIAAYEELTRTIEETRFAAEQICADARRHYPPPLGQPAAARLKELAARYTMHSERRVHEVITGTQGSVTETESAISAGFSPGSGGDADSLGDNIELF